MSVASTSPPPGSSTEAPPRDRMEALRFLVVGGGGTLLNMAVFGLCVQGFGVHYMPASVISFLGAVTSNYHFNRLWTFRSSERPNWTEQYLQFFTLSIVALGVNLIVLRLAVAALGVPPIAGQLAGIAAGTVLNFAGNKLWVFRDRDRSAMSSQSRRASVLAVVLVVAVHFRCYGLSKESLWIDEAFSVRLSSGTLAHAAHAELTNPPLYFVLLHFWIGLFGTAEAAVRSLSIVPSVLAVGLVYLLGRRLYDDDTGLLAAGFMAISDFHVYYAQETRAFALLTFLLLASMICMDLVLDDRASSSRWWWLAYGAATVAALYTHVYAVFFVAAENAFFVLGWRTHRRRLAAWVLAQTAILAAYVPWMMVLMHAPPGGGQLRRYLFLKVPQTFFSFLAGDTLIPLDEAAVRDIRGTLVGNWFVLTLAVLGFGIVFVSALRAARRYRRGFLFFVAMCLGPMVLAFLASLRHSIFDERYLIGVSPVLYLFLASGVAARETRAVRGATARTVLALAAVFVGVVTAISLSHYYFHPRFGREQWREAVGYVERNARPGDLVAFDPGFIRVAYDYYAKRTDLPVLDLLEGDTDAQGAGWLAAAARLERAPRVWLVRSHDRDDIVFERLKTMYEVRGQQNFPKDKGIDVYVMER